MPAITRKRGDTYPIVVSLKVKATGQPLPVAGCTFILSVDSVQEPQNADTNMLQLVGNIVDADAAKVSFPVTSNQADQPPGRYWYEIQITDPSLRIRSLPTQPFIVVQDLTK